MAALPYMQLYVADYLADTAHLSTMEHGAYLLLIFNYWQRGESFRAGDERTLNKRLASVARLSNEEWESVRETLSEFFRTSPTEWRHERIEHDLETVNAKSKKASAAGKASAARRLDKRATIVQRTLNHTDTDTDTDKSKSSLRHRADDGTVADAFESRFWPAYPRKVGKADAAKAFAKLKPDDALLAVMLSALAAQRGSEDWRRDGGQFVPHPATWINGKRWLDEVTSTRRAPVTDAMSDILARAV